MKKDKEKALNLLKQKTNDFKTILNNQIEAYEDEKINKQAQRLANAIKN